MSPTPALDLVTPDARTLLRRVDARIVLLRRAIRHDHGHAAFWSAFGMPAPRAQSERTALRAVANRLHVERATARSRLHGFASLEDQRAFLGDDPARFRDRVLTWLDSLVPVGAT